MNKVLVFLLLFAVLGVVGCAKGTGPTEPLPPTTTVEKPRQTYLLNCELDLTPRIGIMQTYLDFRNGRLIKEATDGRASVYAFDVPWYYGPQSRIVDRHGNAGFLWQNCPGRAPHQFTPAGMKRYGDEICRRSWNTFNKDPQGYQTCLNRGQ